jgi:hypothetical protein
MDESKETTRVEYWSKMLLSALDDFCDELDKARVVEAVVLAQIVGKIERLHANGCRGHDLKDTVD